MPLTPALATPSLSCRKAGALRRRRLEKPAPQSIQPSWASSIASISWIIFVSSNQDQARLIAERVARRLAREPKAGDGGTSPQPNGGEASSENRRARIVNFVSSSAPTRTQSSIGY